MVVIWLLIVEILTNTYSLCSLIVKFIRRMPTSAAVRVEKSEMGRKQLESNTGDGMGGVVKNGKGPLLFQFSIVVESYWRRRRMGLGFSQETGVVEWRSREQSHEPIRYDKIHKRRSPSILAVPFHSRSSDKIFVHSESNCAVRKRKKVMSLLLSLLVISCPSV